MKKTLLALSSGSIALFPLLASAQSTITSIVNTLSNIINQLIPLLLALALLAFFWGLIKYIWNSGNAEAQDSGKNIMIAGIVGLFVMVSIWGIVGIIANTFGIQTGGPQKPPTVSR